MGTKSEESYVNLISPKLPNISQLAKKNKEKKTDPIELCLILFLICKRKTQIRMQHGKLGRDF